MIPDQEEKQRIKKKIKDEFHLRSRRDKLKGAFWIFMVFIMFLMVVADLWYIFIN